MSRLKRTVGVLGVALLLTTFAAIDIFVAAPKSERQEAAISASPSPCAHPGTYEIRGSGFAAGEMVYVRLTRQCVEGGSLAYLIWGGKADAKGDISFSRDTESCTGIYIFDAEQTNGKGRGRRSTAQSTLVVY